MDVTISFQPSGKKITVSKGTLLFDAALQVGLPVASSCSAEFVCGRCNMEVLSGAENLSPQREIEKSLLERQSLPFTDRVSCVTRVYGDCIVTTSYW